MVCGSTSWVCIGTGTPPALKRSSFLSQSAMVTPKIDESEFPSQPSVKSEFSFVADCETIAS